MESERKKAGERRRENQTSEKRENYATVEKIFIGV